VVDGTGANPGKSGFLLLDHGESALLWRAALAGAAERTIDAQYFIWGDDNIGRLAAEGLVRAAERGVRIRLLIDDFGVFVEPRHLALLDVHRNIEVRLYNPTGVRSNSQFMRILTLLGDFERLNRRMHNKAFIVDGSIAIIGGRNLADEYYDQDPVYDFRDLDVLMAGPVVPEVAGSFDIFWNSRWSVPIGAIVPVADADVAAAAWYEELHAYAADETNFAPRFRAALDRLTARLPDMPGELIWAEADLFYDLPGKNEDRNRMDGYGRSGEALTEAALATERELIAETPYLIFLPGTFDTVEQLRARGVEIRVLTNSFGSRDHIVPFACYERQREDILRSGVQVHEIRPDPSNQRVLMKRLEMLDARPVWGIHAKTAVFDRSVVYVGTFNMDPRSTHLNTELGVLIRDPVLADQVAALIEYDMAPENSWRLSIDAEGDITWRTRRGGQEIATDSEPGAGWFDAAYTDLVGFLYNCNLA